MSEQEPAQTFIALSVNDRTRPAGHPVMLQIALHNTLDVPLEAPRWSPWFDHDYSITGPDGRELRRTLFGDRAFRVPEAEAMTPAHIDAGGVLRIEVMLSRIFDMTRTGTYRVSVRREVKRTDDGVWLSIESDPIDIVVTD